jgi:hypothetical protein
MELKEYNQEKLSKYCGACGKELVQTAFTSGYNTVTGEKNVYYSLECPKRTIMNMFKPHFEIIFDDRGDEIITRND